MLKISSKKGFTLIELLIVISIIGILAVVLLPSIISAPATARDAGRKTAVNSVLAALEQYKSANGDYPANDTTGCLPPALNTFFKGSALPVGANAGAAADSALKCNRTYNASTNTYAALTAGAPTGVAYCKLSADTTGYSYIVAIRMENQLTGNAALDNHALKTSTLASTCPTSFTAATVNAPASESTYWYYMVQ